MRVGFWLVVYTSVLYFYRELVSCPITPRVLCMTSVKREKSDGIVGVQVYQTNCDVVTWFTPSPYEVLHLSALHTRFPTASCHTKVHHYGNLLQDFVAI